MRLGVNHVSLVPSREEKARVPVRPPAALRAPVAGALRLAASADSACAAPTEPAYGAAPAPQGRQEAGFFRALFDVTFTHFITVKFSSFLYVIAIVVALLVWLLQKIDSAILTGVAWGRGSMNSYYGEGGFNAVPLILAILFGWIPSVIALLVFRLGLEFSVATVRTAQNTTEITERGRTAG